MSSTNSAIYVLIHDATSDVDKPFYEITQEPYVGKQEISPNQHLLLSNCCKSYSELRETLIAKHKIPQAQIPPSEYFAPTDDELADKTDPIVRPILKN